MKSKAEILVQKWTRYKFSNFFDGFKNNIIYLSIKIDFCEFYENTIDIHNRQCYNKSVILYLRGRVQFPTGG